MIKCNLFPHKAVWIAVDENLNKIKYNKILEEAVSSKIVNNQLKINLLKKLIQIQSEIMKLLIK